MADYRMLLVIRAVDKITQMQGVNGNEVVINRKPFLFEGQERQVPVLSANGLRHVVVREPGGLWLIDEYGLDGRMNKSSLRLLVGGGNNASISGGAESLRQNVEMRRTLPLLGLMGAGLPDGPKAGVLKFSDAVLVCNEARPYLDVATRGFLTLPERLRPARTCVGKWTHYRHDPTGKHSGMLAATDIDAEHESSGMIFGGEAITPGSLFVSEIHLSGATELELGAFLWSVRLWQQAGGYVGGMSNRGNGRTDSMLCVDGDADVMADAYCEYARRMQADALMWLNGVFGEKPAKVKKGKKAEATA